MLSKMSCLNKSIIKSDLKRFWYLAVLNTLVTFFTGTFIVMDRFVSGRYNYNKVTALPGDYYFAMILGMGFALLTTVAVFSYLNKSNQAAFCHAFPIKRKCHYLSHLTSVVILTSGSAIINSLIIYLYTFNSNVATSFSPLIALKFFIIYMTYSLLIMSLTAFTQMLTGLSSASVVLTVCFVAIPAAFEAFLKNFLETHVYGYFNRGDFLTTKIFYLSFENILSTNILIYLALIAILLLLGYILYKYRKIECNGEVVAYAKMRPVFIYTVALFTGMASYVYFGNFYSASIFFLLPFGLLGIVIAFMLAKKSFNLRGVHKPIIVYILFVLVLFFAVKFDITGYERRLPDLMSVESVEFYDRSYYNKEGFYPDEKKTDYTLEYFLYDEVFDEKITDFAEIEDIIALHSYKIENRKTPYIGDELKIKYNLKNGKTLERRYFVDVYEDKEYLEDVYESEKVRGMFYELANGLKREMLSVEIFDDRMTGSTLYNSRENREAVEKISNALTLDMLKTPYDKLPEIYHHEGIFPTNIKVKFNVRGHYENEKILEKTALREITYIIYPTFENTWRVLDELGYTNTLPTYEDVKKVGINIHDYDATWGRVQLSYAEERKYMYEITDSLKINELYEWAFSDKVIYPEYAEGHKDVQLFFEFKNGTLLEHNFIFDEAIWPDALKNLY